MVRKSSRPVFLCETCGHESARWMGFCPACGARSPLVEFQPRPVARGAKAQRSGEPAPAIELSQVATSGPPRIPVPFDELARVLGGGLVPGSVVLMAGEPGVGKSTLLLQAAQLLANQGGSVAYIAGEESPHQVKVRAERLGLAGDGVHVVPETDVELVVEQLDRMRPSVAVVDSIQTMSVSQSTSGPGSASQVRECGLQLTRWAKGTGTPLFMAGHITKDGGIAGPMVLEHMVDVVLFLEADSGSQYRVLRSVKNRFGSTNEIGIFQMGTAGLVEVPDPSEAVLSQRGDGAVGSAIVPILEGTRPLLVEIQALTSPSVLAVPRRVANGVDYNRLLMLVAVLTRRVGINLSNQDIIANVAGGIRVQEPAADLALALAIVSSMRNLALPRRLVALGEVGLSGELRSVPQAERRLVECTRLGLSPCLVPTYGREQLRKLEGVEIVPVANLSQAISRTLPRRQREHSPTDDEEPWPVVPTDSAAGQ